MPEDSWVNAVIELVIPLNDVKVESDPYDKQEAVGRAVERIIDALPPDLQEHVASGRYENVRSDD